jgi:TRAP-type C4-dicarboxylate transport system permease small subunit
MQCLKCGNECDPDSYECHFCSAEQEKSARINQILAKAEDFLIELFLGLMVLIVLGQILMRNIYQSGIPGGDELVRHLVLWIAFFGAAIATRSRAHVKIDAVKIALPDRFKPFSDIAVNLFSCIVCCVLVYASAKFVYIEYQSQGHSTFLNLPIWMMEIVLPAGYLVIAVRFGRNSISSLLSVIREA